MAPHFYKSQFQALRWRLWLSSMGVIALTLTAFGIAVYQIVAYSLSQKLNDQLVVLADAAAHSLPAALANSNQLRQTESRSFDNDGDLDIPWQDLRQNQQGIEWFDAEGRLLGQAGQALPQMPLSQKFRPLQQGESRLLTLPVQQSDDSGRRLGYIRVSESTAQIREELERLQSGLAWGGLVALLLSGTGSWWLMRQSLRPIEQSVQQLKQFTADASHELRNPLAGIKTSVAVMQSHPERIHPADVSKLAAIASATDEMTHLVADLLMLARTEGSLTKSDPADAVQIIPIDELLEDVIDAFALQAVAKQIEVKALLSSGADIRGDVAQIKRLFSNLLANALQYGGDGVITVGSELKDDWVIIWVEDQGIGLAPDQLPYVFDRFWRADQARSRHVGGTGLGLAIAQTIAQSHRGKITVSSQLGTSSRFQVELPTV